METQVRRELSSTRAAVHRMLICAFVLEGEEANSKLVETRLADFSPLPAEVEVTFRVRKVFFVSVYILQVYVLCIHTERRHTFLLRFA